MLKGYLYAFQKALERATHASKEAGQIISRFLDDDTPRLRMAQISRAAQAMRCIDDNLSAIEEIGEIFDKVQGEMLNRLTQENASLKEQLAELRESESTYLSIIREAGTSPTYSLPPKSGETLLDSLQRRRESLTKILWRYEEQKAQYGPLDAPPYIVNAIEQVHEELKPVESTIAYLEASTTEMK